MFALTACANDEKLLPNVLLIVADDLGYLDLGVYGGEIATPNLDSLARDGIIFTQFYASPMCSPSRAMLLTGVDNHVAGLGNMSERLADNQKGRPGYEGHLNRRVVTIAELLRDAGYRTYVTGKWHLGSPEQGADPAQRGFDRSFVLLESGAGHFANMLPLVGPGLAGYSEDGTRIDRLPDEFYSTRSFTDKMLGYLDAEANEDRPFFAYLSFSAPHFPLQAPADSIARYTGRYDGGYDELHARRLARMQQLGLIADAVTPFPRLTGEPAWNDLSSQQQAVAARTMEIYAAMVDDLDRQVGRVISQLKRQGKYDNTVIVFLSDNGAEGHRLEHGLQPLAEWAAECCDNSYANLGRQNSYVMLGPNWARAAAGPFRMFKGFTSEGGIRVPAFVHFPKRVAGGRRTAAFASIQDVMPTLMELAGVEHPGSYRDRDVVPMQGRSMLELLLGERDAVHDSGHVAGWELLGKRAIRQGRWKIIWETSYVDWWDSAPANIRRDAWQLYDLQTDPAERIDLSAVEPAQLERMIGLWNEYAAVNSVIIPDRARGY
ncbi:MAG: arylsulfatase [Gammaproteobacteria bacterium]|nr:arylsulfatase [Gammaproteobacteria bacterium]